MASSTTPSELTDCDRTSLAKALAPEDVRVGDYVAVLQEVYEFPALVWCDEPAYGDRDEVVRIAFTPQKSGEPLKVCAVCLPFVLVKPQKGKVQQIDVRRLRLARLDPEYAAAWKEGKSRKK